MPSRIRHARGVLGGNLQRATVGGLLVAGLLVAGAGTGNAARTRTHGDRVPPAKLKVLAKEVAKARAIPKFVAPGPPVKASVVKGKSALVFPVNSEIGQCQTEAEDFKKLGGQLGMHVSLFSDSGDPTQWQTAIEDATSAHDSALVMFCGVIPGAVGPQLQAAEKAGVKVVDDNYNEVTNYKLLDAETAVDTAGGMRSDVADALVRLHGKPLHALVVSSDSIVQGPAAVKALKGAIRKDCGKACTLDQTITVPIQNWATQVQSDVSSALQAHKDVNAVFVVFDGMTTFVMPAVESAHEPNLRIFTWGGSTSVEKLMEKKGGVIAADPGLDPDWGAYGAMDQVIRLIAHKHPASVKAEVNPNRFWVPSNVRSFFGPHFTYGNGGYGGVSFMNGFRKLWGLKPIK